MLDTVLGQVDIDCSAQRKKKSSVCIDANGENLNSLLYWNYIPDSTYIKNQWWGSMLLLADTIHYQFSDTTSCD